MKAVYHDFIDELQIGYSLGNKNSFVEMEF